MCRRWRHKSEQEANFQSVSPDLRARRGRVGEICPSAGLPFSTWSTFKHRATPQANKFSHLIHRISVKPKKLECNFQQDRKSIKLTKTILVHVSTVTSGLAEVKPQFSKSDVVSWAAAGHLRTVAFCQTGLTGLRGCVRSQFGFRAWLNWVNALLVIDVW